MNFMSVKKEFSKYANQYNSHNIIQQIVAKSLVRDIKDEPKKILELGCGSGQIFKYINWNIDFYKAIDFSESMVELHPRGKNISVECFDFDSEEFFESIKNDKFNLILSSSAMQWSKNLSLLVSKLIQSTSEINAVLFTSNTFKTIQDITQTKSPILAQDVIKKSFEEHCKCEFEVLNYNLEFDSKKALFDYIKKSGVSGSSNQLSFKDSKKLIKEYNLNYLEFEVIFVKAFSKS